MLTGASSRAALRSGDKPPSPTDRSEPRKDRAVAALRPLVTGYAALTCLLLAIGALLTHALNGSVGRWDEHVNRWFVAHRTDFWNSLEAVGGRSTWHLGGALNCGKAQPGQVAAVSHGCPSVLVRGVNILNTRGEGGAA